VKLIENWFSERYSENLELSFRVKDLLLSVKTDYQRIDVFDTYDFGKLLTIDGTVQMTEYDEFVYHEMITSVPLACLHSASASRALVIGGGDGGTARRLVNLGFKNIVNVEIDNHVVEVAKRFFPDLTSVFGDGSAKLVIGDGIEFVKNCTDKFDVVIVDSTDPEGPAQGLFSTEFYRNISRILTEGGIMVTQSGSPYYQPHALKLAVSGMKPVFREVKTYLAFIPTYPSGLWSFTLGGDSVSVDGNRTPPSGKYFNDDVLEGCFRLPEFIKKLIAEAT
jgi:spermidine synthase